MKKLIFLLYVVCLSFTTTPSQAQDAQLTKRVNEFLKAIKTENWELIVDEFYYQDLFEYVPKGFLFFSCR